MQKHTNRILVAAVLIAAALIGGFFVFTAHRGATSIARSSAEVSARIDRMIATATDIASAEQAYVAPGQPDQPWLERGAMLLQQFGEDAAALRPLLQSAGAPASSNRVDTLFKSLVVVDAHARQDLRQTQSLLAADRIFSEGHDTIAALVGALKDVQNSEQGTREAQRAALEQRQWITIGLIAALWLVGLIALVPSAADPYGTISGAASSLSPGESAQIASAPATRVNLTAAADVCSALARTTNTASLRDALRRAAVVLDARGIIVWMGAGEELFPAISYGYDDRVVERLGPIPRNAANATAEAWRTAQMRTVASDVMSDGAVAAPMSGISGCVGVFAAEVRNGREEDPGTRAVAAMIAAQLAGIVPAWPAASGAPPDLADSGPLAASGS